MGKYSFLFPSAISSKVRDSARVECNVSLLRSQIPRDYISSRYLTVLVSVSQALINAVAWQGRLRHATPRSTLLTRLDNPHASRMLNTYCKRCRPEKTTEEARTEMGGGR